MSKTIGYWVAVGVAIALTLTTVASVAYFTGNLNQWLCEGSCPNEYIESPVAIESGPAGPQDVLADITGPLDARKVNAIVNEGLDSAKLGSDVSIVINDFKTGFVLMEQNDKPQVPASSLKLLTAAAALETLGPHHRFETSLVKESDGTYVLVGGGDPSLTKKSLKALATSAASSITEHSITVDYDTSLFSGPTLHPDWTDSYFAGGASAHVVSLRMDPPFRKPDSENPVADAVQTFAGFLVDAGFDVTIGTERKHSSTAQEIAIHKSPRLSKIVESLIRMSDNYATEVLGRHLAIADNQPATFDGSAKATTAAINKLGIDAAYISLADVSGLSPKNQLRPVTVVQLLSKSVVDDQRMSIYQGLPVGGLIGTLDRRFGVERTRAGRGFVRAKTGTLNNVTSLSGIVLTADGGAAVFSLMTDQVPDGEGWNAEIVVDAIFAKLAACECVLEPTA